MELKRINGRELVATTDLVPTPKSKDEVSDPLGYYALLGLDPRSEITDADVRKSYWVLAKRLHPDGSQPNEERFYRVQKAYTILKDEQSREQYEAGSSGFDEDLMVALLKKLTPKGGIEALKSELDKKKVAKPKAKSKPVFDQEEYDHFAAYYYEGEELPPLSVREEWADCFLRAMLKNGVESIKLGFTTQEGHVAKLPWGTVIMASGIPSVEAAEELISSSAHLR